MPRTRTSFHALLLGLLVLSTAAAKDKKAKPDTKDPQDQIEVVGHIALTDGPVRRFVPTQHYSSHYLYAEHEQGKLTLIDVTKAAKPAVLADVTYPAGGGSANLFAVTGTAALVAEGQGAPANQPSAQTMDFSDPQTPKVDREFVGVTAMSRDESRGLIFIANPEGVWILRQRLAEDPEVERAYAHHVVYDH